MIYLSMSLQTLYRVFGDPFNPEIHILQFRKIYGIISLMIFSPPFSPPVWMLEPWTRLQIFSPFLSYFAFLSIFYFTFWQISYIVASKTSIEWFSISSLLILISKTSFAHEGSFCSILFLFTGYNIFSCLRQY